MRGIDELRRHLENSSTDADRALRIENLADDLVSAQHWLAARLDACETDTDDAGLWINCAHNIQRTCSSGAQGPVRLPP